MDEVHKSVDIPEAPKKNGSGPPGHIPLPPPPPPGGLAGMAALSNLMKPFSKSARRAGADSPDSSVYSPGNQSINQSIRVSNGFFFELLAHFSKIQYDSIYKSYFFILF